MGTNVFYGMGRSADGTYYNNSWTGGFRQFAAVKYLTLNDGATLKFKAGTADTLEYLYNKARKDSGSNLHFAFGSIADTTMPLGSNNPGGDWADMKPIPTSLADTTTWQAFSYQANQVRNGLPVGNKDSVPSKRYILTMNEIAEIPSSYGRAAWNLRIAVSKTALYAYFAAMVAIAAYSASSVSYEACHGSNHYARSFTARPSTVTNPDTERSLPTGNMEAFFTVRAGWLLAIAAHSAWFKVYCKKSLHLSKIPRRTPPPYHYDESVICRTKTRKSGEKSTSVPRRKGTRTCNRR